MYLFVTPVVSVLISVLLIIMIPWPVDLEKLTIIVGRVGVATIISFMFCVYIVWLRVFFRALTSSMEKALCPLIISASVMIISYEIVFQITSIVAFGIISSLTFGTISLVTLLSGWCVRCEEEK